MVRRRPELETTWNHPSLDWPPAEYTVGNGVVLKGQVIVAYYLPAESGYEVRTVKGVHLGFVECPVEAMLKLRALDFLEDRLCNRCGILKRAQGGHMCGSCGEDV